MYACPFCRYVFDSLRKLVFHVAKSHNVYYMNNMWFCPACGKRYRSYRGVLLHVAFSDGDLKHSVLTLAIISGKTRKRALKMVSSFKF